jgi:ubiquinone/menaquinone biosynthesis C-methylase UbiE
VPDTSPVAQLFDLVAADYDQSGVAFFQPIAQHLVDALDPRPGERCLDVGSGRGAVTRLLVDRVGTGGDVLGVDLSAEMVRQARADVHGARFEVGDATAPPGDGWDVIASSLVLFFLPDPVSALTAWREALQPGGRVGVSTFGPQDPLWEKVDAELLPWMPERDPRSRAVMERFATDEGVEAMFREAGLVDVRTVRAEVPVVFADTDQWFAFSMSTGQRIAWLRMPDEQRPAVRARCEAGLEATRRADGAFEVGQRIRVTTGRRPA